MSKVMTLWIVDAIHGRAVGGVGAADRGLDLVGRDLAPQCEQVAGRGVVEGQRAGEGTDHQQPLVDVEQDTSEVVLHQVEEQVQWRCAVALEGRGAAECELKRRGAAGQARNPAARLASFGRPVWACPAARATSQPGVRDSSSRMRSARNVRARPASL